MIGCAAEALSRERNTAGQQPQRRSSHFSLLCIIACALAVYALGVGVRWGVLGIQEAKETNLPFTMESALAFHYGELAYQGAMPGVDARVGNVDGDAGLRPYESLNILAPVFWAKIAKQIGVASLQGFYRHVSALQFCLGILAIFGIAQIGTGSLILSTLSGLGYAIAIPAVLRSTGQELMSENFALPFLFLHIFFLAMAFRPGMQTSARFSTRWILVSALSLSLAWLIWDMTQVYMLVFSLIVPIVFWKDLAHREAKRCAGIFCLCLLATALADPYLRTHGAWGSYPLIFLAAVAIVPTSGGLKTPWHPVKVLLATLVFFCIAIHFNSAAQQSYQPFMTLFWNKLKFLNDKPLNPDLLPYDARALWVPALHSATWARTWAYCGPSLVLWFLALSILAVRWVKRGLSRPEKCIACLGLAFGFLSWLFVRMEVFWIFFAVLGMIVATPQRKVLRLLWFAAIAFLAILEAQALVRQAPYLGKDVDYKALNEVVHWVGRETIQDSTLLASYSLSPSFAAYAHRGIVLQPKYETPVFRNRIREFEQTLMAQKESAFYSLCKRWGVRYYVHSKGFYADHSVNSFRYLVGDPRPSNKTNLINFELHPEFLNCFKLLYNNEKYLVYRVVDSDDVRKSDFCMSMARRFLASGHPDKALRWSHRSLGLNPGEGQARLLAIKAHHAMGNHDGARQEAVAMFARMQIHAVHTP